MNAVTINNKATLFSYWITVFTGFLLLLAPSLSQGAPPLQLDRALANITQAFSSIETLIRATTYVIGVSFVVKGLFMAKVFGSQTMASAQRGEIGGILVHIFIGALLIYLPSTLNTSLMTVFGTTSVSGYGELAYNRVSGAEQWGALKQIAIKYLTLIGYISFIRGWIVLAKSGGHQGAQQGGVGKGLMHIIGGILLINGVATFNILAKTLGYA